MQHRDTLIENIQVDLPHYNTIMLPQYQHGLMRRYSFVQVMTKGNEVTNIRYEFTLIFPQKKSNEPLLFQINRVSPIFIDGKEPDLVIDELAHETGKVFYPLILQIRESGRFGGIYNCEEITDRWPNHKQKIANYFTGEEVDKYLSLMEDTIQSKDGLNLTFHRDLFINTFLAPIYKSYSGKRRKESELDFPLAGKANPVKFKVEEILSEYLTDEGTVEIHHTGSSVDERSFHEMQWNFDEAGGEHEPAEINYKARYTLEEDTRLIHSVHAKWVFEKTEPETIEIHITSFEKIKSLKEKIKEIEDAAKPKEKGFFKDFWDTLKEGIKK